MVEQIVYYQYPSVLHLKLQGQLTSPTRAPSFTLLRPIMCGNSLWMCPAVGVLAVLPVLI